VGLQARSRTGLRTEPTRAGVSQPTVVRFCRSLGCEGLSDFKLKLASGLTGTIPVNDFTQGQITATVNVTLTASGEVTRGVNNFHTNGGGTTIAVRSVGATAAASAPKPGFAQPHSQV